MGMGFRAGALRVMDVIQSGVLVQVTLSSSRPRAMLLPSRLAFAQPMAFVCLRCKRSHAVVASRNLVPLIRFED